MPDEILEQEIDESISDYIIKKVDDYILQLDEQNKHLYEGVVVQLRAKARKLFSAVNHIVESETGNVREEYSARYLAKISRQNQQIAELEAATEDFKEQLAERVHTFLTNSKDEVRTVVSEEMRLDSDTLRSAHVIEEIKALVGNTVKVSHVDESRVNRLQEDTKVLKERLEQKNSANLKLKGQLKVYELLESVPSADRAFFASQLNDVASANEATDKFSRIKGSIRKSRIETIEEEMVTGESRGFIVEDDTDTRHPHQVRTDETLDRMISLAGIK